VRIGELAGRTGLSSSAIRYYERVGLVVPQGRTAGGYRDYDDGAVARLRFVEAAKTLGLSLEQIREILALRDRDEVPCAHVIELIQRRRDEVAKRIDELIVLLRDLDRLGERARGLSPADCLPDEVCHLIPRRVPGQDPPR
jgi:MerR family copper efflux transcriptional regulator